MEEIQWGKQTGIPLAEPLKESLNNYSYRNFIIFRSAKFFFSYSKTSTRWEFVQKDQHTKEFVRQVFNLCCCELLYLINDSFFVDV